LVAPEPLWTLEESRHLAVLFLIALLDTGELSELRVGRFIHLGRAPVPMCK
jgi:hypothetical protein